MDDFRKDYCREIVKSIRLIEVKVEALIERLMQTREENSKPRQTESVFKQICMSGGDMIKNRMELRIVRTVLEMGFDRKIVMKAIEWRLREIGDDYPSAEALLNAVLTLKENPKAVIDATHDLTPYDIPQPLLEPSRHTRYSFSKAGDDYPSAEALRGIPEAFNDQIHDWSSHVIPKLHPEPFPIRTSYNFSNAAPVEPNEADYFKAESDLRTSTQQCLERLDVKKAGTSKTYILSEKEIKNASFERDKHGNQNISTESKKVDLIRLKHSVFLNLTKILLTTIYLMSFLIQVDCQICQDTLKSVPRCPLNPEEYNMESKKCSNACPSKNDQSNMYEYHCLRNTNKTELIEVCAISQYLFDYCPEYDPVGKIIQMDLSTNCSSNSTQSYYNSSDIFHCDVKCFHLYEKQDVVIATRIPVTNETMTPDGEENLTGSTSTLIIILAVTGTTVCIVVILVCLRRILRTRRQQLMFTMI